MEENKMIKDIMKYLDQETKRDTVRMSVNMEDNGKIQKEVSHKGCRSNYDKSSIETVGMLDM